MPVFTNTISSQNQAAAAGISSYPALAQPKVNSSFNEQWFRTSLTPTNGYTLYTETITGSGTDSVSANIGFCTLATSAATNDCNDVWTSGMSWSRSSIYIDSRSQIVFDGIFEFSTTASVKCFIGFYTNSGISDVPTTGAHLGLWVDTGVSANVQLSSSDGTTQTKVDTGLALASVTGRYRLNITWTGFNSATITLYGPITCSASGILSGVNTVIKQDVVSAFNVGTAFQGNYPYNLHFFVKTLTTAAAGLHQGEYQISVL